MTKRSQVPPGMYGPAGDGLGDPGKFTPAERARLSEARLREERSRRQSMSPVVRKLQGATDRVFRAGR